MTSYKSLYIVCLLIFIATGNDKTFYSSQSGILWVKEGTGWNAEGSEEPQRFSPCGRTQRISCELLQKVMLLYTVSQLLKCPYGGMLMSFSKHLRNVHELLIVFKWECLSPWTFFLFVWKRDARQYSKIVFINQIKPPYVCRVH